MSYNVKINVYDSEIQISYYGYRIVKGKVEEEENNNEAIKRNFISDKQSVIDSSERYSNMSQANQIRSKRRSKQTIYDIARSNKWDYFATFTIAGGIRYDYESSKQAFRKFLNNYKTRVCAFEYLVVPEQHKDGAWHFHALLQGDLSSCLSETWHKGRYELVGYNLGKCELELVRDSNRVASYITKYITKDLMDGLKGKRRYFYSKGLKRSEQIEMLIPDDMSVADFVLGNFSEYEISHVYKSAGNYDAQYIQLKKEVD